MDLTVPYTFYPLALPHWIAWTLFLMRCWAERLPEWREDEDGAGPGES
jgi:hypothetical protein